MKICRRCGIDQPIKNYYRHRGMKDGFLNICKECTKKRVHVHRELNIEKIREYDRDRGQTEERKQHTKNYQLYMKKYFPEEWKKMRYATCKKSRSLNHKKYIANSKVRYAIASGKIKKGCCSKCGEGKAQAHHPDYEKPLDIVWLCDKCHKKVHKEQRKALRLNIPF